MNDDQQQLKSKYERLCVEFKKLRTKYKALKDNENETGQQLQENLSKKDAYIKRLQDEIAYLKSHLSLSSKSFDEGHEGLLLHHHHHHLNGVMISDSNHLSTTTSSCLSPTQSLPFTHTTHKLVEDDSGKLSDQVNPAGIRGNNSTSCSTKAVCTDVGVQTESFVGTVSSTLNAATKITVPVSTSDEMSIINKCNSQNSPLTENQVTTDTEQQDPLSLERHNPIDDNKIGVNQNSLNLVSASSMINDICPSVKHLQSESNTASTTNTAAASAANHPASSISTPCIPSSFPCSNFSSTPLVSSSSSLSSTTLPSSVHQGNNDNSLIEQFINLLNNWINSLQINKNVLIMDKEKINKILTSRIGQLESQVCEISLKYQMERKRRLKEQQNLTSDENKNANNSINNSCSDVNESEQSSGCNAMTNLRNSMIQRIASATEEAIYFASRANLLQDEVPKRT
uniref:Uncharacterized protein n=1 Tax=Trichobilharzia regenti TaxID=157069 RepID=A0AA85K990_TRIRE|nr:unnamed protein product [Trichobilharzia regenti]